MFRLDFIRGALSLASSLFLSPRHVAYRISVPKLMRLQVALVFLIYSLYSKVNSTSLWKWLPSIGLV